MNDIQQQYDAACKDMSPAERVARMTDMFNWARELVGRVVRQENPEANTEELKLLVALRMYGCLLYTSPSPRDATLSRMPSSA